jgi:hypothetical protein
MLRRLALAATVAAVTGLSFAAPAQAFGFRGFGGLHALGGFHGGLRGFHGGFAGPRGFAGRGVGGFAGRGLGGFGRSGAIGPRFGGAGPRYGAAGPRFGAYQGGGYRGGRSGGGYGGGRSGSGYGGGYYRGYGAYAAGIVGAAAGAAAAGSQSYGYSDQSTVCITPDGYSYAC